MSWDYIAGFFDGEGSVTHNGKGFRITIAQTNKRVLEEIRDFTGVGNIIEVWKRKSHWKDCWVYYVARQEDIYTFLSKMSEFLIVKKPLVTRVIPQVKNILKRQHTKATLRNHRLQRAKKLRAQGRTYRNIGRQLGIDWGYARRLILKRT